MQTTLDAIGSRRRKAVDLDQSLPDPTEVDDEIHRLIAAAAAYSRG